MLNVTLTASEGDVTARKLCLFVYLPSNSFIRRHSVLVLMSPVKQRKKDFKKYNTKLH